MPYFIYKITSGSTGAVKDLECLDKYDEFKQAKKHIREKRLDFDKDNRIALKMIFAEDEFEAEQRLSATRDAPIMREWEK
ncbi:MAG: hypothetical protein AB8B92_06785 [Gammaproteobacteria bacterium]